MFGNLRFNKLFKRIWKIKKIWEMYFGAKINKEKKDSK